MCFLPGAVFGLGMPSAIGGGYQSDHKLHPLSFSFSAEFSLSVSLFIFHFSSTFPFFLVRFPPSFLFWFAWTKRSVFIIIWMNIRHIQQKEKSKKRTPKTTQKDVPNGPGLVQKWPLYGPKVPKMAQKQSIHNTTFIKVHKNNQIHAGSVQTHPLTAQFHRLKRWYLTVFFQQNKCFIGKKACFCTILHNFGEFWPKFAHYYFL